MQGDITRRVVTGNDRAHLASGGPKCSATIISQFPFYIIFIRIIMCSITIFYQNSIMLFGNIAVLYVQNTP